MKRFFSAIVIGALFFAAGCSSRKGFEPEQVYGSAPVVGHYEGRVVATGRNGVTLDTGHYISRNGVSEIRLRKGFRFLNEDARYVLASDINGTLAVIDKRRPDRVRTIALHTGVISAAVHNGKIAYVLEDNSFGLYDLRSGKVVVENNTERAYAIDARAASPLFVDSLAVMPMLDGKLIIFDVNDPETAKVIYLGSDTSFNNVIFLDRTGDTLVAATPKKLYTVGNEGEFEKSVNIAEAILHSGKLYLFTKEGEIARYTIDLKRTGEKKFTFAQFVAVDLYRKSVYALDRDGSLIVSDLSLKHTKVYDVGEVETPVFMARGRLYKDGDIYDLTALTYE